MNISIMIKYFILTLTFIFVFLSSNAFAGKLESIEVFNTNLVNPYLTLDKIRSWEKSPEFKHKLLESEKQKIFWQGTIKKTTKLHGYFVLEIQIGKDKIQGICENSVRNMDYDRTGYKIAFKGAPVLDKNQKLYFIDIMSIILLQSNKERQNSKTGEYYGFIFDWIKMYNPHYSETKINTITKAIISSSKKYNLDPRLILALLTVESAMDTGAVSSSGALGLGQLMPLTAQDLGVNAYDPEENIEGCAKYLSSMLKTQTGDKIALGLACYNAGPGNVRRYGGIPPFSETKNYVLFIKFLYNDICNQTNI